MDGRPSPWGVPVMMANSDNRGPSETVANGGRCRQGVSRDNGGQWLMIVRVVRESDKQ
jgi:hypothetical protein